MGQRSMKTKRGRVFRAQLGVSCLAACLRPRSDFRALRLPPCLFLLVSGFLLAGCMSRSLTGLTISPAMGSVTVATGQTSQFQAQAIYTESGHETTSGDVTSQVSWQSSNPAVATISTTGLATGVSAGTAVITGSMKGAFGTVAATSNITVTAASAPRILASLAITPSTQTLAAVGDTARFLAIGTYNGGSPATQDLSGQVRWQSSDASVARVDATGLATGIAAGQATITAVATSTDGSVVSASATIVVPAPSLPRVVSSLTLLPSSQTLAATTDTAQFTAIATYSSGSPATQDVTSLVSWRSSSAQIAQISSAGLATGIGAGQATITAVATSRDGSAVSASGTIIVPNAPLPRILSSLAVTPATQTVATVGDTVQLTAIATYTSGSPATQDVTGMVSWRSGDTNIARVTSTGLVTTSGQGQVTITALATSSDSSVTTAFSVIIVPAPPLPRVLTGLSIIPANQQLSFSGETAQFIAIGTYSSGAPATQDLTNLVLWQSSDVSVAQINASGLATAITSTEPATTITAIATLSDGSVITATGMIAEQGLGGGGSVPLTTLTVYKVGSGGGTVTGYPVVNDTVGTATINCGTGTGCIANFPDSTAVLLVPAAAAGSQFDGWSVNCTAPNATLAMQYPHSCVITMSNGNGGINATVGAIFDPTS